MLPSYWAIATAVLEQNDRRDCNFAPSALLTDTIWQDRWSVSPKDTNEEGGQTGNWTGEPPIAGQTSIAIAPISHILHLIWKPRSQNLEEWWRGREFKLLRSFHSQWRLGRQHYLQVFIRNYIPQNLRSSVRNEMTRANNHHTAMIPYYMQKEYQSNHMWVSPRLLTCFHWVR